MICSPPLKRHYTVSRVVGELPQAGFLLPALILHPSLFKHGCFLPQAEGKILGRLPTKGCFQTGCMVCVALAATAYQLDGRAGLPPQAGRLWLGQAGLNHLGAWLHMTRKESSGGGQDRLGWLAPCNVNSTPIHGLRGHGGSSLSYITLWRDQSSKHHQLLCQCLFLSITCPHTTEAQEKKTAIVALGCRLATCHHSQLGWLSALLPPTILMLPAAALLSSSLFPI